MSTEPAARTRNLPSVEEVRDAVKRVPGADHLNATQVARAVLALFAPETVTTADELDALPENAGVLDGVGRVSQKGYDGLWWRAGDTLPGRTSERVLRYGPATVIYRPEEDA